MDLSRPMESALVVVTADIPNISAKADTGSMVQVKGSYRIRPVIPPTPGCAPNQMPWPR